MNGKTIGPNPVTDHDIPVTIRRRSLKYVLSAKELLDVVRPTPPPSFKAFKNYEKIKNLEKLKNLTKLKNLKYLTKLKNLKKLEKI